jgi:hypothetical protein
LCKTLQKGMFGIIHFRFTLKNSIKTIVIAEYHVLTCLLNMPPPIKPPINKPLHSILFENNFGTVIQKHDGLC